MNIWIIIYLFLIFLGAFQIVSEGKVAYVTLEDLVIGGVVSWPLLLMGGLLDGPIVWVFLYFLWCAYGFVRVICDGIVEVESWEVIPSLAVTTFFLYMLGLLS